MAEPILSDESVELVIALRIPIDVVDHVMGKLSGLGKTGETYLVGADKLMRSDSAKNPDQFSIRASFADPLRAKISTPAVLHWQASSICRDISGEMRPNCVRFWLTLSAMPSILRKKAA